MPSAVSSRGDSVLKRCPACCAMVKVEPGAQQHLSLEKMERRSSQWGGEEGGGQGRLGLRAAGD